MLELDNKVDLVPGPLVVPINPDVVPAVPLLVDLVDPHLRELVKHQTLQRHILLYLKLPPTKSAYRLQ